MVLLAAEYRGTNNGGVGITREQAKAAGIGSKNTLYGALKDLVARGLIVMTHPGSRVPPAPTRYALTWLPVDNTEYTRAARVPSRDYIDWTPKKNNLRVPLSGNHGPTEWEQGGEKRPLSPTEWDHGGEKRASLFPLSGSPLISSHTGEVTHE